MKAKELRELTTEELNNKKEELETELFNMRFANASGNLEKPSDMKEKRKTIARINLILHEREIERK